MVVLPWIRKYAPARADEVVGQEKGVARIKSFITNFSKGSKPLLLHGPPGTGKTTSVYAVTNELDLEVIEVNASDARNKAAINELLGAALGQQSLFFKGKAILVDEADGLSGTKDRGGLQALLALIKTSSFPVIITANDIEKRKLKALKKASETVAFEALTATAITTLLERIAKAEGIEAEGKALGAIARRVGGDARAAVNDLQTLSNGNKVTMKELEMLGERAQKEAIEQALMRVFKTTSANIALPAFDNIDQDVDQLFLWIQENLAHEYRKPEDRARAYDALAEADRFFGRIRRWQYYRFYVYIYNLLTAGIALAKEKKYPGASTYKESKKPLLIWMANQRHARRKSIAAKLAVATHSSERRAFQEVAILRPVLASFEELELTSEEREWLAR